MFTNKDIEQFSSTGIEVADVEQQLKRFREGFPFLSLIRAATIGDGIVKLDKNTAEAYEQFFREHAGRLSIMKFVPASGAATRMFKSLFSFMDKYKGSEEDYQKYRNDQGFQSMYNFFRKLESFAFYEDLAAAYKELYDEDIQKALDRRNFVPILDALLVHGLKYGELPKGLLKFHRYDDGSTRTPVEEHMVEAAEYGKDRNGIANLHFTVSPEHKDRFIELIGKVKSFYEKRFDVSYTISFSEQKKSTDTIAVDMINEPFREPDGAILFRPAGHGALLHNLNEIKDDLIFIKNIDNVVPDRIKSETYRYKKIIAGVLLSFQQQIADYLQKLQTPDFGDHLEEIDNFLRKKLCIEFPEISGEVAREYYIRKLNRPIRVCGMVKNEGEPGGGPFWAKNPDGSISLQVVESAQIDMDNEQQKNIFSQATHFNPVDIVCGVKDFRGNKFDLSKYTDPATGFISYKSKDGKDLKAIELPGLWNGSMSDWITIFVEVPIITFNPVKTVNDLLRDEHQ